MTPEDVKRLMGTCETCDNWMQDQYNDGVGGRCKSLIEEHWSDEEIKFIPVPRRVERDFFCAYFREKKERKGDRF